MTSFRLPESVTRLFVNVAPAGTAMCSSPGFEESVVESVTVSATGGLPFGVFT